MNERVAKRVSISGRVQGVAYRAWTEEAARRGGVAGWVKNEPDGTVTAHLEGAEAAIDALISQMHEGPTAAVVERIEVEETAPEGTPVFRVVG
ncbi:acylphosphatase [Rhodobacteraceae bacterium WD3A24]|nr:acylphosphatase [Rhodobacteraceae bacterium WD3A24]